MLARWTNWYAAKSQKKPQAESDIIPVYDEPILPQKKQEKMSIEFLGNFQIIPTTKGASYSSANFRTVPAQDFLMKMHQKKAWKMCRKKTKRDSQH